MALERSASGAMTASARSAGKLGEQDDADAGVGQRIALEVAEEGVVELLARRHSCLQEAVTGLVKRSRR